MPLHSFIYFLLVFIYGHLTFFWEHLFNTIHYRFIVKDNFAEEYGLVKEKACYFTYDRSTKRIINNGNRYFMIPGLFINNNSFEDNIIDAIFYLINFITVIIFIFAHLFSNEKEKNWLSFRILISFVVLARLISLIELTFLHVLGENNPFHQLKIYYLNKIKSLPLTKDFYYCFDNQHFQKRSTLKLISQLTTDNLLDCCLLVVVIILIIAISTLSDYFIHWFTIGGAYCLGNPESYILSF